MRYYKGFISISDTSDIPVLLHIRNARAIFFDQLRDLLSLELAGTLTRTLRWRLARLEKFGLISKFDRYKHLGKPVYGVTQQGLECLETRGHYLLSLPSSTEQILHPSQIPHALELVNIRLAMARGSVLRSWKCDLEISSRNLIAPKSATKDYDAVAEVEIDGGAKRLAIEYERSPKAAARYRAIRDLLDQDEQTDVVLYLTPNDDLLYLLATEMRPCRRLVCFALSESFRLSLLGTSTLTNTDSSDVVPLRELLSSKFA